MIIEMTLIEFMFFKTPFIYNKLQLNLQFKDYFDSDVISYNKAMFFFKVNQNLNLIEGYFFELVLQYTDLPNWSIETYTNEKNRRDFSLVMLFNVKRFIFKSVTNEVNLQVENYFSSASAKQGDFPVGSWIIDPTDEEDPVSLNYFDYFLFSLNNSTDYFLSKNYSLRLDLSLEVRDFRERLAYTELGMTKDTTQFDQVFRTSFFLNRSKLFLDDLSLVVGTNYISRWSNNKYVGNYDYNKDQRIYSIGIIYKF